MRFEELIARPALISHLRETFGAGRVYHAYLFAGPEGVGKRTAAETCAQALFCQAEVGDRPCGECPGCRQFAEGHPDVFRLAVPEGRTQIPVEQVRSLTAALSDRPYSGGMRVVLAGEAGKLNASAQNALLKTLEEPPEGTVFLLAAVSTGALLPTVVSRCQVLRFAPLSQEELRDALARRGVPDGDAARAARFSGGSLGRAISLADDGRASELLRGVQASWEAVRSGKGVAAASSVIRAEKGEGQAILDLFESLGRALIAEGDGEGAHLLEAVLRARRMVAANVTWQYAFERMLMDCAGPTSAPRSEKERRV